MCKYTLEDLTSYVENSVGIEKTSEIRNHLKNCKKCQKNYIALKITENVMRKELEIDNNFCLNIRQHIDNNKYSRSYFNIYISLRKMLLKGKSVLVPAVTVVSVIILVFTSIFLFYSFSDKAFVPGSEINNSSFETEQNPKENIEINSNVNFPEHYTVYKIKDALLEYINYRLWLYPAIGYNSSSDKNFDNYINKFIDVEIRLYNNLVYAHTNIGEWLIVFNDRNGFIYVDGQVSKGEGMWPEDNEYKVLEMFSIQIPSPHKPNYGVSKRKDEMITSAVSVVTSTCEEYGQSSDEWKNVNVYIADFFEYEMGTHARIYKKDSSIYVLPIHFLEENDEIKVHTSKGYTIQNLDEQDEFTIHQHKRYISDAVTSFECNVNE